MANIISLKEPSPRRTEEERIAIRKQLIRDNPTNEVWIFGYGSLMWDPGVQYSQLEHGTLEGYHRSMCVLSQISRGTPERLGLVMGLKAGKNCTGKLFKIEQNIDAELQKIIDREMSINVYIPLWLPVSYKNKKIMALTFVADVSNPLYVDIPLAETAQYIVGAKGKKGSCRDYLHKTLKQLAMMNIQDPELEQLFDLVENIRDKKLRHLHC